MLRVYQAAMPAEFAETRIIQGRDRLDLADAVVMRPGRIPQVADKRCELRRNFRHTDINVIGFRLNRAGALQHVGVVFLYDERHDVAMGHVEAVIDHDRRQGTAPGEVRAQLQGFCLDLFRNVAGIRDLLPFRIDRTVAMLGKRHPSLVCGGTDLVLCPLGDVFKSAFGEHSAEQGVGQTLFPPPTDSDHHPSSI